MNTYFNSQQSKYHNSITIPLRIIFTIITMISYFNINMINNITNQFYQYIKSTYLFQNDTFEPIVASLAFILWMNIFGLFPLFKYLYTFRIDKKEKPEIYKLTKIQSWLSGITYMLVLYVFDFIYPRRINFINKNEQNITFTRLIYDITVALFLYDAFFYWIHYAFHNSTFLYKYHYKHHSSDYLESSEVINLSFIDGALQVSCSILALKVSNAHPFSRMFYNIIITYLLTEIHCGYDCPWMIHNLIPFNILGGSRTHYYHHMDNDKNYHQFFNYMNYFIHNDNENNSNSNNSNKVK